MIMNDSLEKGHKNSSNNSNSSSSNNSNSNSSNNNSNSNKNESPNKNNWLNTINNNLEQLELYKELSEQTLELCDEQFMKSKKKICQDFDTIIQYLNERKVEVLTQLAIELESHKQELESNRDKVTMLIEHLNKKKSIIGSNGGSGAGGSNGGSGSSIGNGGLTHSLSFQSNLSQYLSIGGSSASSFTSHLGYSSNSSLNSSPLKRSVSFQTDYLLVLKEPISVIKWEWDGNFQDNSSTIAKIVKPPKPIGPLVSEILNLDDSNINTIEELNNKFQLNIDQDDNDDDDDDDDNNSINNNSNHNKKSINNKIEKELIVYGKLEFKIEEIPEYRKKLSPKKDRYIYSLGGKFSGAFDQYSIEKYDFNSGLWRTLSPITCMDNDFTANYDGKNTIYIFGGSLSPTKVQKYNILEDHWEKIINHHQNNHQYLEIPDGGRFLHSSVYDNKQNIYLIGGFPRSTAILRFNLITEQFTRQSTSFKSLWSIACCYHSKTNSIYLVGGCNISRQSVDVVERYDIDSDQFYQLSSLPVASYSSGICLDEERNQIYIFGGFNSETNQCLSIVQTYNISSDQWQVIQDSNLPKPMTMSGNSTILDYNNDTIMLLGGYNPQSKESIDQIFMFNIITKSWILNHKIPTYLNNKITNSIFIEK